VGHGKLFVTSGLRRRVSRPHHICDSKLPDGAMEPLRLAGGTWRGPARSRGGVGPIGISEAPRVFRIAECQRSARNLGRRCGVQAAVVEYLVRCEPILTAEAACKTCALFTRCDYG
jgi:hypothetical protein